MTTAPHLRWLTIGDFAAATQLSLKALRLYAEQRLLAPGRVDAATGYRYYRTDQVPKGRLIRTLREMGLSLADIAAVVAVGDVAARRLLAGLAKEQDQRYAREKRAYHAALLHLQPVTTMHSPQVTEHQRPALTVACREFLATCDTFIERYRAECQELLATLGTAQLANGGVSCRLVDPLCDDEGRMEIVVPVQPAAPMPAGISFRQLAAARCALTHLGTGLAHASQLAGALDTLFDWFDQRGYATIDCPCVTLDDASAGLQVEITWPFATTSSP